ncbi:uncharacterized protein LOC142492724 [Ascaphus truei]|uniref:uncharacterized protein LOC142492724 n=1 Tax=Ascaphus truei TaxID=8439 RepID=UPI003F59E4D0
MPPKKINQTSHTTTLTTAHSTSQTCNYQYDTQQPSTSSATTLLQQQTDSTTTKYKHLLKLQQMRERAKVRRDTQTPEERSVQNLKRKNSLLKQTEEQYVIRLEKQRQQNIKARANKKKVNILNKSTTLQQHPTTSTAANTTEQHEICLDNSTQQQTHSVIHINLTRSAFSYEPHIQYQNHQHVNIGHLSTICPYCQAKTFPNESAGMCCRNGKILLPPIQQTPNELLSYMSGTTSESKHFLQNIRKYNSCFQMTSFGATSVIKQHGFQSTFKVQGQVYHRAGSLLPLPNENPKFLQIYFMGDEEQEADQRCHYIPNIRRDIVLSLQKMLHQHNHLINTFKTSLERMPTDEYKVVIRADKTPVGEHERRFNAPQVNEVAIVIAGQQFDKRDIILQRRTTSLQRIYETHRSYDALQYPLIFSHGDDGYHFNIMQVDTASKSNTKKTVSSMNFYAYRIMIRHGTQNHILHCRQLFHQFIVDMYAKIESERLLYIRLHQKELRVDQYIHLKDAVVDDGNIDNIGKILILPASFTGSPRHMHEYAQDAMSYVRAYGRPDFFITFTCNPSWTEIKEELYIGQAPSDRHDLVARVFKLKLQKLMNIITNKHIFGQTRCWMYSIEWQKRGLPHAHILIWLKEKLHSIHIDNVISAELPNQYEDPILFAIITKNMIHGPCGNININSPCMKDGTCTKKFPKQFLLETQSGDDGYPRYRRRAPSDGGYTATIHLRNNTNIQVDNKWIVPYSPLLSKTFNAHINVEYCNSVKSIKYICKYVNKGSDMAIFGITNDKIKDEISLYQLGRYISSNEAVWRILSFPIHQRHPTVVHLTVHLENGQRVYFTPHNAHSLAAQPPNTTLTAFFQLCQNDSFAKTLLYPDIPKYYTWNSSTKIFNKRKHGVRITGEDAVQSEALGRVYTVHPNNAECFFLRMLLHNVPGPTSFTHLKTVDGHLCQTYREACQKLGLLEDDQHSNTTLSEAVLHSLPNKIRNLFAIIITTCHPSNPNTLWDTYKDYMSEDILAKAQTDNPTLHLHFSPEIYNEVLILLEDKCLAINNKTLLQLGVQSPERHHRDILNSDIMRERNYNIIHLKNYVASKKPMLIPQQLQTYQNIMSHITKEQGAILFLDAPGGTGKTFLINLLLAEIRMEHNIALAIASSGIAATLMDGGRTVHSALKLPLNIANEENPTCNITKNSGQARVLQTCKLIVWDECTMAHKKSLEALDRTLKDLRNCQDIMGGAVILLAGDFRQTLPVIPRSTPADELHACLKSSHLWHNVKHYPLTTNMRVQLLGESNTQDFANKLLQIGEGTLPTNLSGEIDFPTQFAHMMTSLTDLIHHVYPNIIQNYNNHQWLCERAILAAKNNCVNDINHQIQDMIPGNITEYKSIDTVVDNDEAVNYPTEFLNSLEPPGMPPHRLRIKIGTPIMLLRNLNTPNLCNGTRLCIKTLMPNLIEATILTGKATGEDVFIPRIPLIPTDMPFNFKRLQFPIRLAFAITINKSQGQSIKFTGINLQSPCFSHGQLYVACSRVGSSHDLYIFAPNGSTKNVVYKQALQ